MTENEIENDATVAELRATLREQAQLIETLTAVLAGLQGTAAQLVAAGTGAQGAGERITLEQLSIKALTKLKATSTYRTYAPYIRFLVTADDSLVCPDGRPWAGLGTMWVDEVLPSHLEDGLVALAIRHQRAAEQRAAVREAAGRTVRYTDGVGARYNAVGAWRHLFTVAENDRHLKKGMNPAALVTKPKRSKGTRFALEDELFAEMTALIGSTGDDPELDAMILRFIDITGARQEGVLNLTLGGIDAEECTVRLIEKNKKKVDQPVPDFFIAELLAFAAARGAVSRGDAVFRKRLASGQFEEIGPRRFNYIFGDRLQASLEWADRQQVTAHTLRHHAITRVERHFGHAVAVAFGRHEVTDVSGLYSEATRQEVAHAVVKLFGGDHPWLHRQPRKRA